MDFIDDILDEIENASTSEVMTGVVALIFVMVVICIICWIIAGMTRAKEKRLPIHQAVAHVVEKDNSSPYIHYVTFEFENGQREKLVADPRNKLVVGDVGKLSWQGNKIVDFVRGK